MTEVVNYLNSLFENVALNANNELENDVIEVLDEILKVLSSPQVDQVLFSSRIALKAKRKDSFRIKLMNFPQFIVLQDVIDALSFQLPKVTSKFANLSSRCLQLVEEIVDRFVEACNPRDMLLILSEVIDLELDSDQASSRQ